MPIGMRLPFCRRLPSLGLRIPELMRVGQQAVAGLAGIKPLLPVAGAELTKIDAVLADYRHPNMASRPCALASPAIALSSRCTYSCPAA